MFIILPNRMLTIYDYHSNISSTIDISKEDKRDIDYASLMLANGLLNNAKECFE